MFLFETVWSFAGINKTPPRSYIIYESLRCNTEIEAIMVALTYCTSRPLISAQGGRRQAPQSPQEGFGSSLKTGCDMRCLFNNCTHVSVIWTPRGFSFSGSAISKPRKPPSHTLTLHTHSQLATHSVHSSIMWKSSQLCVFTHLVKH